MESALYAFLFTCYKMIKMFRCLGRVWGEGLVGFGGRGHVKKYWLQRGGGAAKKHFVCKGGGGHA